MTTFRVGARTDVGRVRSGNEDSFMVQEPLFAVADGMGGHQGGEVASKLALDTVAELAERGDLAEAVREANRTVFRKASQDPGLTGMGTTLTVIRTDGDGIRIAHIGDSRLYLLRDGALRRVTTDHTVVERLVAEGRLTQEDAEMHPQRSILTKALGVDSEIEPDEDRLAVRPGDRLLLCSDGLTGMIDEARVGDILGGTDDPQAAADTLVDAANEAGGQDNITAVVVDVVGDGGGAAVPAPAEEATGPVEPQRAPRDLTGERFAAGPRRRGWGRRLLLGLLLPLVLIGAGLWAVKTYWVDRQFYVGASEGNVAIFRGIPARPLGLDLSTEVEAFDDLDAAAVEAFPEYSSLSEGITADSEEDARAIVEEMRGAVQEAATPQNAGGGGGGGGDAGGGGGG